MNKDPKISFEDTMKWAQEPTESIQNPRTILYIFGGVALVLILGALFFWFHASPSMTLELPSEKSSSSTERSEELPVLDDLHKKEHVIAAKS